MAAGEEVDFFISYAHPDRSWAAWIAWQLEEAGFRTTHQDWDFQAGSNFVLEMQRAAENSKRTIVVLSPAFIESSFAQPEWAAAFAKDPQAEKRTLIPVRVCETSVGGLLLPMVYVDLVGLSAEEARVELLRQVSGERLKPESPPDYPAEGSSRCGEEAPSGPSYPGDAPAIWNVPRAGRNFSGREALIEVISSEFDADSSAGSPAAVVLHGLGGVGKTQVAAALAWRRRAGYDVVWWVRAAEISTRTADFSQLARELGLKAVGGGVVAEVEAIRLWLGQHQRWLLIFDDAPDEDAVRGFLPASSAGEVLVTSRRTGGWRSIATPIEVDAWSPEAAAAFLLRRSGKDEEGQSHQLASALGGLPLAIEQAGAYIDTMRITLADYRERLKENAPELFDFGGPVDYGKTVRTTWELSFGEVEEDDDARAILVCCSLLAPDRIPEAFIVALLPDSMRRDKAIERLLRFSLISPGHRSWDMHLLVQQAVRERTSEADREAAREVLLEILVELFPERSHPGEWPVAIVLLPHALLAMREGIEAEINRPMALRLADRLGEFHHARGELKYASVLFELIAKMAGEDEELARRNLTNLGTVRMRLGDVAGAQAAHEDALEAWSAKYGNDHPSVAASLDNLGIVMRRGGQVSMAIGCHQAALKIFEGHYGKDCEEVAATLDNLANAFRVQGEIDAALENLDRALAIKTREYGEGDYRLAKTLDSLGSAWLSKEDWQQAGDFYERALALQEATLGREHHELGGTLSNLGIVLLRQGELAKARIAHERALQIIGPVVGNSHSSIAIIKSNLGNVARSAGEEQEARELFEEALTIKEETLGSNHPDLISTLLNLGDMLSRGGELDAAGPHVSKAHALCSQYSHPSLGVAAGLVARLQRLEAGGSAG